MNWQTHDITNQFDELNNYALLETDPALLDALQRGGADDFLAQLTDYGRQLGRAETYELATLANRHTPELQAFDARGRRQDQLRFHPSWHTLMAMYRQQGLIAMPFADERPGRWSAWAAGFYLHAQIEAGSMCPATMTQAAIPVLRKEPALWAQVGEKLLSTDYDARDLPIEQKTSVWIGMGMTEKQGGSDVRANTTTATPQGAGGRGQAYLLRGHKWFFSAPMSDAHLVVARTPDGSPSCFFVPRWRPDGSRNAVHIQRLKDKVGNRSNSSSEVEFHDAYGILMGEEGRGIPTIIEMASFTRLNCVIGSAAILRQGLVQAIAYARQRQAFGRVLVEQPLMRSVLADVALESEAATVLMMRLAQAYEHPDQPQDRTWMRVMTPAAKFWVCKRAVELSGELMEVFGGNGYVEEGTLGRLYREAPVNSIWEGSGNVMCLDMLRAIGRDRQAMLDWLDGLAQEAKDEPRLCAELDALRAMLALPPQELEGLARRFAQRLVLTAQACLLRRHAPAELAEAFMGSRLDGQWGRIAGALDARALPIDLLLERAYPA